MAETNDILAVYMEENFDLKGLRVAGLFQTKDVTKPNYAKSLKDYPAIAERIKQFFGLKRIYDYSNLPPFGTPKEESKVEFVSCKDWLLNDGHLFNLLDNN